MFLKQGLIYPCPTVCIFKFSLQKKQKENYLDKIPSLSEKLSVQTDDNGVVTLGIENKGMMNRIMQKLLKKPKVSYIHLDELGSFAVLCMDGQKDIFTIGKEVKERFGEKAEPLYERLSKFFDIMNSYGFIEWK